VCDCRIKQIIKEIEKVFFKNDSRKKYRNFIFLRMIIEKDILRTVIKEQLLSHKKTYYTE
jgi:hypothetical protein